MALSEASKEAVYLSSFISELGLGDGKPTSVATDNTGARSLSYNPEFHERVKHIERRHFYVRELVEDHRITVPFVSTTENMADFFTKPLAAAEFYRLRRIIMNVPESPDRARKHVTWASEDGGVSQDSHSDVVPGPDSRETGSESVTRRSP